jgi:hypothetical protein
MTFGFQCDEPASVAIVDAAAEAGITSRPDQLTTEYRLGDAVR